MSELLSEDQQSKLLRVLARLSDDMASTGNVGKAEDILSEFGLERGGLVEEELLNVVRILLACDINRDEDEQKYVKELIGLGWIPQGEAESAIARIRPMSPPPEIEVIPVSTETVPTETITEERPPEESPTRLLTILRCVSVLIATEGDVELLLTDMLHSVGLSEGDSETNEIKSYIKILQQAHINPGEKQTGFIQSLEDHKVPKKYAARAVYTVTFHEEALKAWAVEDDIEFQITRRNVLQRNYVRAVMLAQQQTYFETITRYLQELALKQYASVFRNLPGFRRLVEEYEIPKDEVERILNET